MLDDELEHHMDKLYFMPENYVYDALNFNTSLKAIDFGKISDEVINSVCKVMETNKSIEYLRFEIYGYVEFFNVGDVIESLSSMITKNNTLKRLDIWGDYTNFFIDHPKIVKLFEALGSNSSIEYLQLICFQTSNNQNSEKQFNKCLEKLLQNNTSLKTLNLCHNNIKPDAMKCLRTVLQKNTTLEKIILSINGIGDEGLEYIKEGLKKNTTLKKLDLTYNSGSTKNNIEKFIEEIKESNTTLRLKI